MGKEDLLLYVKDIKKSFGITKALKGVPLELRPGEILGLIGENGSGKSTLTSIIAGILPRDDGEMFFKGQPYEAKNAVEANEKGICMIMQEKATVDNLSVAHNIFVGNEHLFTRFGILDNKKIYNAAEEVLESLNIENIDVRSRMGNHTFEDGKLVELARASYLNPEVLIVDEATTALSQNGREILYDMMKKMKDEGKGVIFISHDIDEMIERCDRLSVLRDGEYVGTLDREDFSPSKIKSLMVGREVADNFYRTDTECKYDDEIVLKAEGIETQSLHDVSFELHKGEILGFGGLADSGMHDLGKIVFGADTPQKGTVLTGADERVKNPKNAMKKGIAYISKNRDQESLFLTSPIKDNIAVASYPALSNMTFISPKKEKEFAITWADKLDVKMQDTNQYVLELSGGNKQKVALAKWLGFGADIFVLDCPTRGIDIGVKASIYDLMEQLKKEGKSIILISEEMQEVMGMSDRIIVLKNGSVSGEFRRDEHVTETDLIDCMV